MIRRLSTVMLCGVGLVILVATTVQVDSFGQEVIPRFSWITKTVLTGGTADTTSGDAPPSLNQATLRDLPSHPSTKLAPYMNPAGPLSTTADDPILRQFHDLLNQYVQRQGEDDNFTVRVIDGRSNETLEVYELTSLRSSYERGESIEWEEVDRRRRRATRRLVDKYDDQGVPREDIIVRWGRANQIEKAHERDRPYRAYEIKLARYLDLSLLPTEIATVETFNRDDLVSPVGARSRYQMMPWILRRSGVNEYHLYSEGGTSVHVQEELHPLLTLEPAYKLLRGYVNAVGHEIPGLSAYHTGPGNIYKLYRQYYSKSQHFSASSTVVDAFAWALTEGYETVSEGSSFGSYSRGYVPSAYGALVATDDQPVDPSETLRAARVQLKPDTRTTLAEILQALDSTDVSLDWGPASDESSTYEQFKALNPHFDLPDSRDGEMPSTGNVHLVSSIDGKVVQFFLPLEAPSTLEDAGLEVLNSDATFRFDDSTYAPPSEEQITYWDRQYQRLVDDIKDFGFTPTNRQRLLELHEKFEELAEQSPSRFRRIQLDIIDTHRRIWLSNPWDELSDATMLATGRLPMPIQPLDSLSFDRIDPRDFQVQSFD